MKIAVWHALPSGGGKRALYGHIRGLVSRGHQIRSWAPTGEQESYLSLARLVDVREIPIPNVSRGRVVDALRQIVFDCDLMHVAYDSHCRQVAAEMNAWGCDVLFANTAAGIHVPPLARYVDAPSLLYLQEPQRMLYEAYPTPPFSAEPGGDDGRPRRPSARWMYGIRRKALRVWNECSDAGTYDCLAVNSLYSRESVLRAYGLDSVVCYLGVDTNAFVPQRNASRDYLVTMGQADAFKNIGFIVAALGCLEERDRLPLEWIANVTGRGEADKVSALATELGVDLRLRVNVNDDDLVRTLGGARAFVYAPRLEPFGLAPLEAAACGVPSVAVAEGGVREQIVSGVTGILTTGRTVDFASGIRDLVRDKALAADLGVAARSHIEARWSSEMAVDRIEMLLARISADLYR